MAAEFLERLNVSEKVELETFANLRDALGPNASVFEGGSVKGFFYPATRVGERSRVVLIHSELSSRRDIEETLCHEILGHYGLNLLPPDAKRRFLEAIDRSRELPSVRPITRAVEKAYPNADRLLQVEEILAQAAETLPQNVFAKAFHQVARVLVDGLRAVGFLKDQVTLPDMHDYLCDVAVAIRRGAPQRTYPKRRDAQFAPGN